jgi:hypothetical protein
MSSANDAGADLLPRDRCPKNGAGKVLISAIDLERSGKSYGASGSGNAINRRRNDLQKSNSALERLEEAITPETVRRVWQIVIVDAHGNRREGEKIEWQGPRPVPVLRERYR